MNNNHLLDTVPVKLPDDWDTTVPDSADPYLGWKVLRVDSTGMLYSPAYTTAWPALQPLQASCGGQIETHQIWKWAPIKHALTPTVHHSDDEDAPVFRTPAGAFGATPPIIELPDGYHWDLELEKTPVVHDDCSCGIYAVDDPDSCHNYLQLGDNTVLVQVALWGRLIRGSQGARGQYAYPQQIVIPGQLADQAQQIHDNYQVPVIINPNLETGDEATNNKPSRSKYLKPSFAHIALFLLLTLTFAMLAAAAAAPPLTGLLLLLSAGIPIYLVVDVFRSWDILA